MNELGEIRKGLNDLTVIVKEHIAETKAYRSEQGKVMEALTSSYWNKDGMPGVETKVDRLMQAEKNRKWITKAFASSIIALALERIWNFFK